MLKFTTTSEEFEALEDSIKGFYTQTENGYQLNVEGAPDVSGLTKKVNELLGEKKAEKAKREAAEAEAKKLAEEEARKRGDIESLEKSWQEKLNAETAALKEAISNRDKQLHTLLVDNQATQLAVKLAGESAPIIMPHIKSRLAVQDGKTRVLDVNGQPSALTIDDLAKEFQNNKIFSPIIIGSQASGIGDTQSKSQQASGVVGNNSSNDMVQRARQIIEQG